MHTHVWIVVLIYLYKGGITLLPNRNMNARNFGLRSRDIDKAAKNALREAGLSYSSIATNADRFHVFSTWLNQAHGIRDLRFITQDELHDYGKYISNRVGKAELAVSTAQNYLSAVNTVMRIARCDSKVEISPSGYVGERTFVRTESRARCITQEIHTGIHKVDARYAQSARALSSLIESFGLRFKEASLLDCRKAYQEAKDKAVVSIINGTKGGRARCVPIRTNIQLEVLRQASQIQGTSRSLIQPDLNYKEWRTQMYAVSDRSLSQGWHAGRHLYAQEVYERITGCKSPLAAGVSHGKDHHEYLAKQLIISIDKARLLDKNARSQVSVELGHGRISVTNNYLG